MGSFLLAFGLGLGASGLLTFPVMALVRRFGIVDRPNDRSSHQVATARAGGLAIVLAFYLTVSCLVPLNRGLALSGLCLAAVALVSFRDDIGSISFTVRLATQALAAGILVIALGLPVKALELPGMSWSLPPWLGVGLAILFVVAYCNFFNFMDGINGLAAGQGAITGAALALLLWKAGAGPSAMIAAALSGAAAGFLPHNFPSARIFMGDVGSVTLGFTLALLTQSAHSLHGVPWTALLLVHAVFLFDACFTVLKRARRADKIWTPHREHNYQLLVRSGWPHSRTTLLMWLLSLESCLAGLIYAWGGQAARWPALLLTAASLLAFAALAHRKLFVSSPEGSPLSVVMERAIDD